MGHIPEQKSRVLPLQWCKQDHEKGEGRNDGQHGTDKGQGEDRPEG